MNVVFSLGNPGPRYAGTRHNLGFWVADVLARRHGVSFRRRDDVTELSHVAEIEVAGTVALLAKPRTYMNRVGRAALDLCRRYRVGPESLVVVQDDADLELGRVRVRPSGSAGGHNGVRSLIAVLGSEAFPRIKLGVRGERRGEEDLAGYVLEAFDDEEVRVAEDLAILGAEAVESVLGQGLAEAMNRFNGRSVRSGPGAPTAGD